MVFNHTQLDVSTKLLPELVVVLLLSDFLDHVQSLADQLFADDLKRGTLPLSFALTGAQI